MNKTKKILSFFIFIGFLGLLACSSVEYRSDKPKKEVLLPLDKNKVVAKSGWSKQIGQGVGNNNARLIVAKENNTIIVASADGKVVAIDSKTGNNIWQKQLPHTISAGITSTSKLVFLGSNAKVIALDLKSGSLVWQTTVTSEILAPIAVDNEIALVHSLDGGLTALNINDGHQLWRFTIYTPDLILRKSNIPNITKEYVLAGFSNGKVVAINKENGTVNWSVSIASPKGRSIIQRMVDVAADLVVKNDLVYAVSYQGKLKAILLNTGQVLWERELSSYAGLTVDDKKVYVVATNGDLLAFDHMGNLAFIQTGLHGRTLSKPVWQKNMLVVGDEDGYLHWLTKDGEIVGRYKYGSKGIESAPVVAANKLYVYSVDGKLGEVTIE